MDTRPPEGQKPVAINKEAVKTLAIAVGVREAARQTGLNENTLLSWSKRDQWFVDPPKPQSVLQQKGEAISAIKAPSTALQELLSENSGKIKHNFSKASVTASQRLAEMEAGELLDKDTAQAAKHWAGTASQVHSWEEKKDQPSVMVNIALLGVDPG